MISLLLFFIVFSFVVKTIRTLFDKINRQFGTNIDTFDKTGSMDPVYGVSSTFSLNLVFLVDLCSHSSSSSSSIDQIPFNEEIQ